MNHHRIRPLRCGALSLALGWCLLTAVQARASGGEIRYPAAGNIDLQEGTLEVWFTPMTELYPSATKGYQRIFTLFDLSVPEEFFANCVWFRHNSNTGLKVSMKSEHVAEGLVGLLPETPRHWRRGEPHHVAFTWKGRTMRIFADGLEIGGREQLVPFTGSLGGVDLVIGAADRTTPIIVHAVRVSSIARDASGLTAATPQADLATRLLDVFDRPPTDGRTRAEVISAYDGATGGEAIESVRFVTSPRPGLALYSGSSK